MGSTCPAADCRVVGGRLQRGVSARVSRTVLWRSGAQHVAELARLRFRRVRSGRHDHCRQAPGRIVAAGLVASDLWLPHLGACAAANHRRCHHDPRAVPRRSHYFDTSCGPHRRGSTRSQPDHGAAQSRQHFRLAAHHVPGVGRRRVYAGHRDLATAAATRGVGVGWCGVPGEDGPSLAGLAGHLARVRRRGRA